MKSNLYRVLLSAGMAAAALAAAPGVQAQMSTQADPAPYGEARPPRTSKPGLGSPEERAARREEARELNQEGRLVPQPEKNVRGNKVQRADRESRRAAVAERRQRARAAAAERNRGVPNPEKGAE